MSERGQGRRFLLDEDIHPRAAQAAWEMDVDAVSVHELGRRGRSDYEQLMFAAEQGRVLVTRNRGDYLHWTREFFQAGRAHAGVLLLEPGLSNDQPERIARSLRRWSEAQTWEAAGDVGFGPYHVDFLSR